MRISDWSSDVCSSGLLRAGGQCTDTVGRVLYAGRPGGDAAPVPRPSVASQGAPGRTLPRYAAGDDAIGRAAGGGARPLLRGDDSGAVQLGLLRAQLPCRPDRRGTGGRSDEHTSELQSLMRISYAVFR